MVEDVRLSVEFKYPLNILEEPEELFTLPEEILEALEQKIIKKWKYQTS